MECIRPDSATGSGSHHDEDLVADQLQELGAIKSRTQQRELQIRVGSDFLAYRFLFTCGLPEEYDTEQQFIVSSSLRGSVLAQNQRR